MRQYKEKDFRTIKGINKDPNKSTGSLNIPYSIRSKDNRIEANFVWKPNDVTLRVMYEDPKLDKTEDNRRFFGSTFANYHGQGIVPDSKVIMHALLKKLKDEKIKKVV